jgi:hypothetical protein
MIKKFFLFPRSLLTKCIDLLKNLSKQQRIIVLVIFTVLINLILISGLIYFFKLDAYVFKSKIHGQVVNSFDEEVEAEICINEECTKTNSEGMFEIGNLKRGGNSTLVTALGYKDFEFNMNLKYGENDVEIILETKGAANISGKLNYTEEIIREGFGLSSDSELENIEINIQTDGNFSVRNLPSDLSEIVLDSPNYKAINIELAQTDGSYSVGEYDLVSGADLSMKIVDFLSKEILGNVMVKIEGSELEFQDGALS